MKSILLVKTFLGLVEMTSWLVNASLSLPEWQAVKMIFFGLGKGSQFWFELSGGYKKNKGLQSQDPVAYL